MNYIKVILWGLLLIATSLSFGQNAVGDFEVLPKNAKFKKVDEGEKVVLEFTLFNKSSTSSISVSTIESSCTCTTVEFSTEPIAPGTTMKFRVVFNTANKFGFQQRPVNIALSNGTQLAAQFQGMVKGSKETIQQYKESKEK